MKQLDTALSLHQEIDNQYAAQLRKASVRGQLKAVAKYRHLRQINDGAYFVIIFATFEKEVTHLAKAAVQSRSAKAAYRNRRAWETIPGKPQFKDRVRLVLDQKNPAFNKIETYYDVRNDLAHKGATARPFSIPNVVADLKAARKAMRR